MSREYKIAEQIASKRLATDPRDGPLWENLAVSQYVLGEKEAARSAITTALIYLPDDVNVQYVYHQITTNQPIRIGK